MIVDEHGSDVASAAGSLVRGEQIQEVDARQAGRMPRVPVEDAREQAVAREHVVEPQVAMDEHRLEAGAPTGGPGGDR
jgi:hypothetical protein